MDRLVERPNTMLAFHLAWLVSRLNDPNVMQLLLRQAIYLEFQHYLKKRNI